MAKYPTVFCHGFCGWGQGDGVNEKAPYWGITKDRDIISVMNKEGFECYSPSLGPWSSAWDRACELWAVINGGTVDYGKAHSERYGHERFGKTYEKGLVENWGSADAQGMRKKINLVGHSFGGPAVRMLAHLLTHGSAEERGTDVSDLSPLFEGGRSDWVNTVVTLAGVNNGTAFASWLRRPGVLAVNTLCLNMNMLVGETPLIDNVVDLHTEYWHVMPEKREKSHIRITKNKIRAIHRYNKNRQDSVGHEMQIEGMRRLNEFIDIDPDAYYFAYRGCRTHPDPETGRHVSDKNMSFICKVPERFTGSFIGNTGADKSWYPNDGFVNVKGAGAPFDEPSADYAPDTTPQRGIWYNMPVENKDHLSYMGVGEDSITYISFIRNILTTMDSLA